MSEAPERIWAWYIRTQDGMWLGQHCAQPVKAVGAQEYIRADIAEAQKQAAVDLLQEIAKQKLGSEMEYPMNADWRGGFETVVLKARRLIREDKTDVDMDQ